MASLKGSKTEENLKAAFAGESQANRRYLYFAQKADVEGYNDVAIRADFPDEPRFSLSWSGDGLPTPETATWLEAIFRDGCRACSAALARPR